MPTELERDDDIIETEEEALEAIEEDQPEVEETEEESAESEDKEPQEDEAEEEEYVVMYGGQYLAAQDQAKDETPLVKKLRNQIKELEREKQRKPAESAPAPDYRLLELPKMPTLAQFDYDEDAHEKALKEWQKESAEVQRKNFETEQRQREEQQAQLTKANERRNRYQQSYNALPFKDKEEAKKEAAGALSLDQQNMLIAGLDNPALVVYALGKNPSLRDEIAGISDPVQFLVKIGSIQERIKMEKTKKTVPTEKRVRNDGAATERAGSLEAKLDKLRQDVADGKPGAMAKLMEAKRKAKKD